jgi:hypothetical protein
MGPSDRPSDWRLSSWQLALPWGFEKWVLRHHRWDSHHPNERRDY